MKILAISCLLCFLLIDNCWSLTCVETNCIGKNCNKNRETECVHGDCSPDGSCQCHPCYAGTNCSDYKDLYHPIFLKKLETIFINTHHKGLIYEVSARDDDNYKTCNPDQPCPCSKSKYKIFRQSKITHGEEFFEVDPDTGDLRLKETAKTNARDHFILKIATANFKNDFPSEEKEEDQNILTLHVRIRESNSMEENYLKSEFLDIDKEKSKYLKFQQTNENSLTSVDDKSASRKEIMEAHALKRKKRDAYGYELDDVKYALEITNAGQFDNPLMPGSTVTYKLTIILPEVIVPYPLDIMIEICSAFLYTSHTTLVLSDVAIESIGSQIKNDSGNPLTVDHVLISATPCPEFGQYNDRMVIDFGILTNTDTVGSTDYTDSTIIVTFSSLLIINTNYTEYNAMVTVLAEANLGSNYWVAQESFQFDSNTSIIFATDITLYGPEQLNLYTAGNYEVHIYFTNPDTEGTLEIYTPPGSVHDYFSIESLIIAEKGHNHRFLSDTDTYEFHRSVTGQTNYKAIVKFPVSLANVLYSNLAAAITDVDNRIIIVFNIFMFGGFVGEETTMGLRINVEGVEIWTALVNITLNGGIGIVTNTGSILSGELIPLDTSTAIPLANIDQTVIWGVKLTLESPTNPLETTNANITCTATAGVDNFICGVLFGESGMYIGVFPNLVELVQYDNVTGSASWSVIVNTSVISEHQTRVPNEDYVFIEVTVMYTTDVIGDAYVECNGYPFTMTAAVSTGIGVVDMTGDATLMGNSNLLYPSATMGMKAILTFTESGTGYNSFVLQTAGDILITTWGAIMCQVDVYYIGRGVGCIAKSATTASIEGNTAYMKSSPTSLLVDGATVDFGTACGARRDKDRSIATDQNVTLRVFYRIPTSQTIAANDLYGLSLSMILNGNTFWSGWTDFIVSNITAPVPDEAEDPGYIFFTSKITEEIFKPIITSLYIKMHPGTIRNLKLTVTSSDSNVLEICRVVILNLGRNFACIDQDPYGKHNDPEQTVILFHEPNDWGFRASLDMGLIQNFGTGDIEPSFIADEDTLEIVTIYKGIRLGTAYLTLRYFDGREDKKDEILQITIIKDEKMTNNSIIMTTNGLDGTLGFFDNVMKQLLIVFRVPSIPDRYDRPVYFSIINTKPDEISICYIGLVWAGLNIPCVVPPTTQATPSMIGGYEAMTLMMNGICYHPLSINETEKQIHIRAGVMVRPGVTSTSFDLELLQHKDSTMETITINSVPYVPGNHSADYINLSMTTNETETLVIPGKTFWLGLNIEIPAFYTVPVVLGIMSEAQDGRAFATITGFRWCPTQGKNTNCPESVDLYVTEFYQYASTDGITMYHKSQNDTLISQVKYMSNSGVTHMQHFEQPIDDMICIELDLLIADHDALADRDPLNVTFALLIDSNMIVLTKQLTLDRSAAPFEMQIKSSVAFTEPDFDPEVPITAGNKLKFTTMMRHIRNESQVEAYDAYVRITLPGYIRYVNISDPSNPPVLVGVTDDSYVSNITSVLTVLDYLEFKIDYLLFTDILELNFTVTVDPYDTMVRGRPSISSTIISRLICRKGSPTAPLEYCGDTEYIIFKILGADCYTDLAISSYEDCQFLASSSIDASQDAHLAKTSSGWSPAVRDMSLWEHFIKIDFKRIARVSKIKFIPVDNTDATTITLYTLEYSDNGNIFSKACDLEIDPTLEIIPPECRFEARYAKVNIVSVTVADPLKKIGVYFEWYGCYVDDPLLPINSCTFTASDTPLTTSPDQWRHVSYDLTNNILYYCDWNPIYNREMCYSSSDGTTWYLLPSYIGSLLGYDAGTGLMYVYDITKATVLSSKDGRYWFAVDSATVAGLSATAPTVIVGEDQASSSVETLGPNWTGDVNGLYYNGDVRVKWTRCCNW